MTVFLITGSGGGIGRHLAATFYREGHRLFLTDLEVSAVEAYAAGWDPDRVRVAPLDVRREEDWRAALEAVQAAWGRLDVLINAAGYVRPGWIHEIPLEEIARHFEVNAIGVLLGTRLAAEVMVRQGGGHILHLGSLAGVAPIPGLSLYTASKFAVRGFCLAAALELRRWGVFLTVIQPDAVWTPMLAREMAYDESAIVFSGRRILTPADVERAVRRALRTRPLEVMIPWSRGVLARAVASYPSLALRLEGWMRQRGLRRLQALRQSSP